MAKKKTLSPTQRVEIAVGLTAAAVAAAGTYFLYGSQHAAQNRKKVKSWMLKAKADVLDRLEEAKSMSQEEYEELIENVAATYSSLKDATQGDISAFKREMKDYWQHIEKEGKQIATSAAKGAAAAAVSKAGSMAVKKAKDSAPAKKAKKTAKKATKKAAKTAKKTTKKATKTAKKATKKAAKKASTKNA